LMERMSGRVLPSVWHGPLKTILDRGPLSRRILRALDGDFSRPALTSLYRRLADCLAGGRLLDV
jgi:carboxylate-amine ligase